MPEISIIIPTYNSARYVTEAIESVLNQTYKNFEIIVIDDGSTDNTKEVLHPYLSAGQIQYIYQKNKGPGAARNTGIKVTKGAYIAFLDSDDSWTKDSLEKRFELIRSSDNIDLVFSDYFYQQADGQEILSLKSKGFLTQFSRFSDQEKKGIIFKDYSLEDIIELPFHMWTGTVLVKKTTITGVGSFRNDINVGEDTDMWLRLVKKSRIGFVDKPCAYYRRFRGRLTSGNPLDYAQARLVFFSQLLKDNKSNKCVCNVIRKKIAIVYYDLASYFHENQSGFQAKKNLLKCIYNNPWDRLPYEFLVSSMLPERLRKVLKILVRPALNSNS
ncbi:MAG: glycosyltransferase family 2 protein [Verrucomicrobiales bacterium]|nr:glycosyltransferase family 2 protein [Nitrospinaceae bacterium]